MERDKDTRFAENKATGNDGGSPSDTPSAELLKGKASCLLIEPNGCTTRWEGQWELSSITGDYNCYTAQLVFKGRLLEITTQLDVSPDRIKLGFPDWNCSCFIENMVDNKANNRTLIPLLGYIEATTVSYCLAAFKRADVWATLTTDKK